MKLLGYLIPPWVRWVALALLAAAIFGSGWQVRSWKCAAAQKEALQQAQKRFEAQLAKQNNESERYEAERNAAREESRNRETQVRTIYRDRVVPAECEPDPGAVSLLREAVDSANAPASQSSQPVRRDP